MVGWALRAAPSARNLPCHRVVNRRGELSGGWHFGHPDVMRDLLLAEGVSFLSGHQVDLARCVWDPADQTTLAASDSMDDLDHVPVGEGRSSVPISIEARTIEFDDQESFVKST